MGPYSHKLKFLPVHTTKVHSHS